jgi:hypothetical protein
MPAGWKVVAMETWQIVLFIFFVLLPFALMLDFWPNRERVGFNGAPLPRTWKRQVDATAAHDGSAHDGEH